MAESALKGKLSHRGMTTLAADPNTAFGDALQVFSMTEGAGVLDIRRRVMEGIVRPCPVLWMGIVDAVAAFASVAGRISFIDPDIEPRVVTGAAGLAMATLAECQVGLGIRTVLIGGKVASIQDMGYLTGTFGMTVHTVVTGRETTWCQLVAA